MRKIVLLLMAGLLCLPLKANIPPQESNELVWCGIDYSLVKFIGSADQFNDLPKIQSYYFRAWNEIIQAEAGKYDLNNAFSVNTIHYNMENSILRSQEKDMSGILQIVTPGVGSGSFSEGKEDSSSSEEE